MEQYVKGFKGFHAGEDVRPVTSCKFLLPRRRPLAFVCQRTSAGRPMQSKIT